MSKPENQESTQAEVTEESVIPAESELMPEESSQEDAIVTEATHRAHWLAMLLAAMAIAGTGVLGWIGWQELAVVNARLNESAAVRDDIRRLESALVGQTADSAALRQELQSLSQQVDRTADRNQSVVDRVEAVAEQLARSQVDTRTSYTLAEAEYLLRLADQRMRIERNPENAVVLMRTAQALLGQLEDGRLLPIREQLAGDIQTLASIERIDVLGIQAEILALDAVLDRLQLPVRRLQPPPSESQEADAQSNWLTVLSEYVRIRQVDAPITPLVTAADAGRAREVLRLNLEQIKVALIREDQPIFDASVAQAIRMTTHYFSTTEGAGLRVLQTLEQLQGQSIARDIPDASTGLRALQAFRASEVSRRAIADEVRQ